MPSISADSSSVPTGDGAGSSTSPPTGAGCQLNGQTLVSTWSIVVCMRAMVLFAWTLATESPHGPPGSQASTGAFDRSLEDAARHAILRC
jgi:hypothetical protein